jgi:hypothetical protein
MFEIPGRGRIPGGRPGARWDISRGMLTSPMATCHEGELLTALVKSKARFVAYEAGVSALSTWPSMKDPVHGHRRLAWLCQGIDVGFVGHTVAASRLPQRSNPTTTDAIACGSSSHVKSSKN